MFSPQLSYWPNFIFCSSQFELSWVSCVIMSSSICTVSSFTAVFLGMKSSLTISCSCLPFHTVMQDPTEWMPQLIKKKKWYTTLVLFCGLLTEWITVWMPFCWQPSSIFCNVHDLLVTFEARSEHKSVVTLCTQVALIGVVALLVLGYYLSQGKPLLTLATLTTLLWAAASCSRAWGRLLKAWPQILHL